MIFGNDKRSGAGKGRIAAAINTLIAEGTTIQGDVRFAGGLHLAGSVSGSIFADGSDAVLTISETGSVEGEVRVSNAVVNGAVNGDMFVGERLELASSARIEGNTHYKVLEIAAGAQINGKLLYQAEPLKQLSPPQPQDMSANRLENKSESKLENKPEGKPENKPAGGERQGGQGERQGGQGDRQGGRQHKLASV